MPKFYLFGICYMGVRLFTNIFGTFLPFYLTGVLHLGLEHENDTSVPFTVALVPLIVYLSSTASSLFLNKFYIMFGRKAALSTGTVICVIAMGLMLLLTPHTGWVMYILAAFIGTIFLTKVSLKLWFSQQESISSLMWWAQRPKLVPLSLEFTVCSTSSPQVQSSSCWGILRPTQKSPRISQKVR